MPRSPVEVVPYDQSFADRGTSLARRLREVLGPRALRIDHIGSTAIPAMSAKPVLDIQVSVDDLEAAGGAFDGPLTAIGLLRRPYERDHVPAGLAGDTSGGWAKRLWSGTTPEGERVNLHARVAGAPNERLALLFRDWFRAHPAAVPAYGRFKTLLAELTPDLATYADTKDPVVDVVIVAAEEWAVATGWRP